MEDLQCGKVGGFVALLWSFLGVFLIQPLVLDLTL
jgi:hypothetical protein